MVKWKEGFTQEERDKLIDFAQGDTQKTVCHFVRYLVTAQQQRVVNYTIETGDAQRLAYLKANADGALRLANELDQFLQGLRKED